jgi:hypothetical protein
MRQPSCEPGRCIVDGLVLEVATWKMLCELHPHGHLPYFCWLSRFVQIKTLLIEHNSVQVAEKYTYRLAF